MAKSPPKKKAPAKRVVKKKAKKRTKKKAPSKKKVVAKKATRKKVTKKKAANKPKAAVVEITRHTEFSISQFSLNTGFQRRTIRKRFADAGISASRMVHGYPVYRVIDGMPILYQTVEGVVDPDKLKPFERRAYYQGELDKLKLQAERGELVPSFEVERTVARLFKILVQHVETLPDTLERDVGANAVQLVHIEKCIDKVRDAMYQEVIEDPDDDASSAAEVRS